MMMRQNHKDMTGANVVGAKRWRVARYRAGVVRAVVNVKRMLRDDLLREG